MPTVVNEWNALSVDTRQSDSILMFNKQSNANIAYKSCETTAHKSRLGFYPFGDSNTNIIHAINFGINVHSIVIYFDAT